MRSALALVILGGLLLYEAWNNWATERMLRLLREASRLLAELPRLIAAMKVEEFQDALTPVLLRFRERRDA